MARPKVPVDVARVRALYLEGGMSFERVAVILGRETGVPISPGTVRARYFEAGGETRTTRPLPYGPLPRGARRVASQRGGDVR